MHPSLLKNSGDKMNEKPITIYIHDLEISDKSKSFLARVGLMKLDDLLNCNMTELSAMRNISEDVLQELNGVIAHSDDIISFFEERAKRIKEILPNVQDAPIESLGLGTRATNALRRGGIHTVGALIQMSQKDIFELRNVGVLSREEITKAIESIVQSGKIVYHEREEESKTIIETAPESSRLSELLLEIESISLDDVPFSVRARNALKRANIQTADELVQMSEKDIMGLRNVGAQTRDEILAVINAIMREGRAYFDNLTSQYYQELGDEPIVESAGKGFDFAVIDILTERFGFKPAKMTEWFGLSRQSVYNALEKRLPQRRSTWTGKTLSEGELSILAGLIENKRFDYTDDEVTCCCMNNRQDDFVCLFIYENEIKCFFLKDLPDEIWEQVVSKKMHRYTERELAGESDGRVINVLTKPFYRPDNPERFRANAQFRGMTSDEYAVFISGYPYLDQRSVTDEQIIAFMQENMVDGKVYISSDPKNQWIRSIASRNGYTIKSFIELYGFESRLDGSELTSDAAKERHREELRQYVVHDNVVYFPTDSHIYKVLQTYTYKSGTDLNSYIRSLGFERTTERPDVAVDVLEKDMEVRQSDGTFEDKVFAMYPLIGSRILKPETVDKLNENARKYIDLVLREPWTKLSLRAEMQITLALINNAKNWKNEENSNFWNYITLQFGYRDASGSVVRLLQSSLENAMKRNHRLFLEDANGRAFKSTVVIHALSTKKSWMALFDFLFDFYKSNLNWRVIPNDPLISVMVHALQQKLSGGNEEDVELTISSKAYSFQEGIRKLILYRPVYTRNLFERLIGKIDSLVNSETKKVNTYEELLCEEWFKEKIIAIANTKKSERQTQVAQRDVAIDYSRIRAKFILKNETDVQLILPDIRLKNEEIKKATLYVSCNGREVMQQNLSWYGNELGKTLNGVAASISVGSQEDSLLNICVRIKCDDEWIYDSEESLHRNVLLFYGGAEISANQVKRDHYTLVVPKMAEVKTENTDIVEIDSMKNAGLKAFFLEMKGGYVLSVDGRLIAFDSENGTDVKVITPSESTSLPTVTLQDTEAFLAFRKSTCSIILGNRDYTQQFVLLKDGERIEFDSLEQSDNGLAFTMPFDGEHDTVRIQVINLANERLMFDRTFVLISEADCCFNREFYYNASDYDGAEFYADIDDFHEVVPFGKDEAEVRIPFRDGELHADIPKITVSETSGAWLQEPQPAWYIGHIPQNSFLKVTTPARINVQFLVGGKDILYDGQGLVTIGNVLQSFGSTDSFTDAEVVMKVAGQSQNASYSLARVFFKERFLKRPSLWTEEQKLFWDQGGGFIGKSGREFALLLSGSDDKSFEFKLGEDTEYVILPEDMPIGNYRFEISIQIGGLFKRTKEVLATGDCIIGDKNLLRFMNRRIVVESITDEFKEEAGHILIRTCYIDQIQYCGMEDTSEGYCPVYSGILYTTGYHGERYEFSFDVHTNKKGITKMLVNPVRIVYISDTALCITDPDGDGLYYYNYYDRSLESVVFALTDYEYTKANKQKYSNADLYSYRTERV